MLKMHSQDSMPSLSFVQISFLRRQNKFEAFFILLTFFFAATIMYLMIVKYYPMDVDRREVSGDYCEMSNGHFFPNLENQRNLIFFSQKKPSSLPSFRQPMNLLKRN